MILNYIVRNSENYRPKWIVIVIDLFIFGIAFLLSYFIRFNLTLSFDTGQLLTQLPVVLLASLAAILIIGSYKGVIRHTGAKDVYNLFNVVCLANIFTILAVIINKFYGFAGEFTVPLSIVIIHSLLSFIGLTAARFIFKSLYHRLINSTTKFTKNVLIYGIGDAGIMTYNVLISSPKNSAKVVGYVDHLDKKTGKNINGIHVHGKSELSKEFVNLRGIQEIIFTALDIPQKQLREEVKRLVDLDVKVKIVPPIETWINGELKASQIKNVQIEDLLDRPPIKIKNLKTAKELENQTVLVTGGAGSIGSELVRQICLYEYKTLVIVDQAESALYDLQQELIRKGFHNFVCIVGDVRDRNRMNQIFQEFKPTYIFHAAAYKHVPLMEYNAYEAIKVNIAGTKVIADLSIQYNANKFVLVSTDKAVNPTNVMGASKRIAEKYIGCMQKLGSTKFIITRFGNVLGSNGSVIPLFKKQLESGGPLTVTHKDITRYFMTIPEASQLVLEAGSMGKGGEIFIFDMGDSVKIFDLAKNMIKLSGLSYPEDIDIKITGLRPGEKLYEELLANDEDTLPTYNKKIMISKVRDDDFTYVRSKIDELCITNILFNGDTVKLMKEIVPEYISKNSKFAELDKVKEDDSKIIKLETGLKREFSK
ncbi:nucleoside-diphosphate sugar epimerase/dehydratase [Maribacter confluentis]|uniref:Nucleoside-diphosphate sugar epimerase/dehydratase n=1 Tax=Maribacter confluentis TaxID=1656093 RepID=A0ABT8RUB8_9FLAO|nr:MULTISPECIES: nucleoside-diphosphate sugar epimerase/dehydratase [Maribacter]MDO1514330.1 nucleoside-diphosphate sugar epimerase/dehydratase [Maribacter confluentis]TVZ13859.1 FlaA1/EpsC-like NDP-sugar epimerase [Maribacter sp. MAR_2009_72]